MILSAILLDGVVWVINGLHGYNSWIAFQMFIRAREQAQLRAWLAYLWTVANDGTTLSFACFDSQPTIW